MLIASISRCDQKFLLTAFVILSITSSTLFSTVSSSPFLIAPKPMTATLNDGYINMTCRAFSEAISFTINETNGGHILFKDLGFLQSVVKVIEPGVLERTLIVEVSTSINNSRICCQAYNITNYVFVNSPMVIIRIQGVLSKPTNLITTLFGSSLVYITWNEPPTIEGTRIATYYVLVNDTIRLSSTTNQAILDISDFAPCYENRISVFGFNGLNGTTSDATPVYAPSIPAAGTQLRVGGTPDIENGSSRKIAFTLHTNASMLCEGMKPSGIRITVSNETKDDIANKEYDLIAALNNTIHDKGILYANESTVLDKNVSHHIKVSFYNLAGDFADISFFTWNVTSDNSSTKQDITTPSASSETENIPTEDPLPSCGIQVRADYIIFAILAASLKWLC